MESSDSGLSADAADAAFDSAFSSEIAKVESAAPETPPEGSTPAETVPVAAASTETAPATGSTPAAEASPVAPDAQDAPEYQNLLAKYGGDKNAAAKSYWETVRATAQLAKEKEELAAKLAAYEAQGSTPKVTPEQQAAKEIPSQLRWYDENIRAVETNFASTQKEKATYVGEGKRLDNEIRTIQRKLNSRDLTLDRDALNDTLLNLLGEKEAVDVYIGQLDSQLKSFDEKWQTLKENRSIREAILEQAKELQAAREAKAKEQEEAESGQYIAQFTTDWNGTIQKVKNDTTVIPAILADEFEEFVRVMGKAHVADGTPIENVAKFVSDAASKFMGGAKKFHSAQSTEYAKLKKDDAKFESPTGEAALATETKRPRSDWTKEQWAAYEENIQL